MFNAQQNMHLDLEAGKEFDVTDEQYAEVFEKRLRSLMNMVLLLRCV